jgi:hypothetical protein
VKLLASHRFNMLCLGLILWVGFLFARPFLPDQQFYLQVIGIFSSLMFGLSLKMREVVPSIVNTSDRFETARRLLKAEDKQVDVADIYRDGALLSALSLITSFGLTTLPNDSVLGCFALALGSLTCVKFGYDARIAYMVLRTEWGPSKAYKPKSTRPAKEPVGVPNDNT